MGEMLQKSKSNSLLLLLGGWGGGGFFPRPTLFPPKRLLLELAMRLTVADRREGGQLPRDPLVLNENRPNGTETGVL